MNYITMEELVDHYQQYTYNQLVEFHRGHKTNTSANPYSEIVKECQEYIDAGLTPTIFHNKITGSVVVTSEQLQAGNYH